MAKAKTPLIKITLLRRDWVNRVIVDSFKDRPTEDLQQFLSGYAQTEASFGLQSLDGFDKLLKIHGKPTIPKRKTQNNFCSLCNQQPN